MKLTGELDAEDVMRKGFMHHITELSGVKVEIEESDWLDYFAGQALSAIVPSCTLSQAASEIGTNREVYAATLVEDAYYIAERMLAQRLQHSRKK